jgi:hypothetical protein
MDVGRCTSRLSARGGAFGHALGAWQQQDHWEVAVAVVLCCLMTHGVCKGAPRMRNCAVVHLNARKARWLDTHVFLGLGRRARH